MKKILAYSASGLSFKAGKPNGIITEDFDGGLRCLLDIKDVHISVITNQPHHLPPGYTAYNPTTIDEWDFSEFDEIIVTGSNLGLYGGKIDLHFVGFVHGLKTFKGVASLYLTDTTIPVFRVASKLYNRLYEKGTHNLVCDVSIETYLSPADLEKAVQFEKSIDKVYCAFYNTENQFTKGYSKVIFLDSFKRSLTGRKYNDNGLFEFSHERLIKKACYIGNYKSKRISRLKKMGIYNENLVDYYGKIARGFKKPEIIKIDKVISCYKNYIASIVVVDPEMNTLGVPHRMIQSMLIKVPTLIDSNIDLSQSGFNEKFVNFIKFNNAEELQLRLDRLSDPDFYNKFIELQSQELNKFLK